MSDYQVTTYCPAREWRYEQLEVTGPKGALWWTGEMLFLDTDGFGMPSRLAATAAEVAAMLAEVRIALAAGGPVEPPLAKGTCYADPETAVRVGERIAELHTAFLAARSTNDVRTGALAAQEIQDLREGAWSEATKPVSRAERVPLGKARWRARDGQ